MDEAAKPSQAQVVLITIAKVIGVLASIYFFLMGLDMMGSSFLVLGGKGAGDLFTIVDNPVTGLMVGILATVLVQSSSTSTSIVVGLVGAGQVTVKYAARHLFAECPRLQAERTAITAELGLAPNWFSSLPRVTCKTGWVCTSASPDPEVRAKIQIASCRLGICIAELGATVPDF